MRNHIWSTKFPGGIQDRSIYFRHRRQHLSHSSFATERNKREALNPVRYFLCCSPHFWFFWYFQRRRSETVKVSVRAQRVRPHSRGAAEEEGRVRGEGAHHDLGRDDIHNGHARHGDGELLQRLGCCIQSGAATCIKGFVKCVLRVSQAVWLYCSCHAAQASKGSFQKTYYKTFLISYCPSTRNTVARVYDSHDIPWFRGNVFQKVSVCFGMVVSKWKMTLPQFHLLAKSRASDVMAAYILILCFCRIRFNGPSAPLSPMKFPFQIQRGKE